MTLLPEVESGLREAIRKEQRSRRTGPIAGVVRWLRSRQRAGMVGLAVLVLSGSATAAVVTLTGQRSAPLSGIAPSTKIPGASPSARSRYDIHLAPSLEPGEISWCIALTTTSASGQPESLGTGSCDEGAATIGTPLFGTEPGTVLGHGLAYVFTAANVAAVQIPGHRTVLTRAFTQLPYGFRAAVFEVSKPTALADTVALSSGGKTLDDMSGPPTEPTQTWLVGQHPAVGACSLSASSASDVTVGSGQVVTAIVGAPFLAGRAFLPCVNEDLYSPTSGSDLKGAVLLDATHPGTPPAALPDMRPVSGHPGVFDRPDVPLLTPGLFRPGMTAKRVGNAWLVVAGGTGTADRVAVLDQLTVGPVQLPRSKINASAPAGSLCTINVQPGTGFQETSQTAITALRDPRPGLQRAAEQRLTAADAQLKHDMAAHPHDSKLLDADRARVALEAQSDADQVAIDGNPFAPTCATATFYYKQRWPLTATVLLITKHCAEQGDRALCEDVTRNANANAAQFTRRVPGHPSEFTIKADQFQGPETVKNVQNDKNQSGGWLIVNGGLPTQQQQLLTHLASTIDGRVQHGTSDGTKTAITFCEQQAGACVSTR